MHALVRSHANPAVSVLAVPAEVRTISCGGVVHAVAAGDGGVHAKIVALAGRLGAGPVPNCRWVCRTELQILISAVMSGFRV